MKKGTGEVLGCDVRREGQIRPIPQGMIGSRRIVGNILPLSIVEVNLASVGCHVTSFMPSSLTGVYPRRRM